MYIWEGSIDSIKADRVWNVLWTCHIDVLFTGKWQLYTVLYVNWIHTPQATHSSKWQNGCEEVQRPDAHELVSKRWSVFSFQMIGAVRFRLWVSVVVRLTWRWRLLTYIIIFKQPKLSEIIFLFVFLDRVTFPNAALQDLTPIYFIWLILISGVSKVKLYLIDVVWWMEN